MIQADAQTTVAPMFLRRGQLHVDLPLQELVKLDQSPVFIAESFRLA